MVGKQRIKVPESYGPWEQINYLRELYGKVEMIGWYKCKKVIKIKESQYFWLNHLGAIVLIPTKAKAVRLPTKEYLRQRYNSKVKI